MNEQKLVWKIYDQRLASAETKTAGEFHPSNRNEEINTRTLMQALVGCPKNCAECRPEEAEWEPKIEQKEVKCG